MISQHDEIEVKFKACTVSFKDFKNYILQQEGLERFHSVVGPDHYYESTDGRVVRHRCDPQTGRHELTVKQRKSNSSTRDRLEVDLHFADKTTPEDVHVFLVASGFNRVFTLIKHAEIYWVKSGSLTLTFVIYDVWEGVNEKSPPPGLSGKTQRYIEIEAEKGSAVTPDTAKRHVRNQAQALKQVFGLEEHLNDSLYEIYSGKKYRMAD